MKQLTIYFTLSYLISWVIWMPLYLPSFGITGLPQLPFHHSIGGFGPMLAAFITAYIYNKRQGIVTLAKQTVSLKKPLYILVALFSPFVLLLLGAGIYYLQTGQMVGLEKLGTTKEFPQFNAIEFFAYNLVFFGFGEEVGWRGFALPRFQAKYNATVAATILTLFWALWHWPLFLYRPGYTEMGIGGIVGWVFSLLTGSILLSWIFNSSKGSILACAIFHATIDVAFMADATNKDIMNILGMLITLWGIATIFVFGYKHLAKQNCVTN